MTDRPTTDPGDQPVSRSPRTASRAAKTVLLVVTAAAVTVLTVLTAILIKEGIF